MPTYIRFAKVTQVGVKDPATMMDALAQARKVFEEHGGKLVQAYATLGRHDFVAIVEAPDDTTMATISAQIAAQGTFTAETVPAIPVQEFGKALQK